MKKYKRTVFLTVILFLGVFIICEYGLAQGIWREKIREKIKERRSQRADGNREASAGSGERDFSLTYDGLARTYKAHIPKSYASAAPAALILAFHGGGGDSAIMADDKFYNLITKSDKEGFIVAFPNGAGRLKSGKFATWNAGNCCGYARDNNIDDPNNIPQKAKDEMQRDIDQAVNLFNSVQAKITEKPEENMLLQKKPDQDELKYYENLEKLLESIFLTLQYCL